MPRRPDRAGADDGGGAEQRSSSGGRGSPPAAPASPSPSSAAQNSDETATSVGGRPFPKGVSGNPGGRPKGLARYVRELVGDDGRRIADFMLSVLDDETERTETRLKAAEWLADPGFGGCWCHLEALREAVRPLRLGDQHLRVHKELLAARPALAAYEGRRVVLGIRPEDMEDASLLSEVPAEATFSVATDIREDVGSEVFVHFSVPAEPVLTEEVIDAL
jgi:hypothetical protein